MRPVPHFARSKRRATLFEMRLASITALLAVLVLTASARAGAQPRDDSSAPRAPIAAEPITVQLPGRALGWTELEGRVAAVRPASNPTLAGMGLREVELSGSAAPAVFLVALPPSVELPFGAGDSIHVRIRETIAGIQRRWDAVITTDSGALLLAVSQSGDRALLADWSVRDGPAGPDVRAHGQVVRTTSGVVLEHGGRVAVVPAGGWRVLATADGRWLVHGAAARWVVRATDGYDSLEYAMVRLR